MPKIIMRLIQKLCLLTLLIIPMSLSTYSLASNEPGKLNSLNQIIQNTIQEQTPFFGLATYYNSVSYHLMDNGALTAIENNEIVTLNETTQLVVVGRFDILLLNAPGLSFSLGSSGVNINNAAIMDESSVIIQKLTKKNASAYSASLDSIRYVHLWPPLAWLAKLVEASIEVLQSTVASSWGWALVIFAILLKLLLLPVAIMTVRLQRHVSQIQSRLAPSLTEIKANFDGEEAHNRVMAAHKNLGVSPFFTLKPILGSFIQIPILIAVFNALGEMQQFSGQSFLWIENLAYPDAITKFGSILPLLGNSLNLLPFAMTAIAIISTIFFQNRHAPKSEQRRQKRNLYLMAGAFFVLFYPFPAVMVLYWTLANMIQIVQQQIIKI
jgi:YidC/Oxa1 family membrane protein insertase